MVDVVNTVETRLTYRDEARQGFQRLRDELKQTKEELKQVAQESTRAQQAANTAATGGGNTASRRSRLTDLLNEVRTAREAITDFDSFSDAVRSGFDRAKDAASDLLRDGIGNLAGGFNRAKEAANSFIQPSIANLLKFARGFSPIGLATKALTSGFQIAQTALEDMTLADLGPLGEEIERTDRIIDALGDRATETGQKLFLAFKAQFASGDGDGPSFLDRLAESVQGVLDRVEVVVGSGTIESMTRTLADLEAQTRATGDGFFAFNPFGGDDGFIVSRTEAIARLKNGIEDLELAQRRAENAARAQRADTFYTKAREDAEELRETARTTRRDVTDDIEQMRRELEDSGLSEDSVRFIQIKLLLDQTAAVQLANEASSIINDGLSSTDRALRENERQLDILRRRRQEIEGGIGVSPERLESALAGQDIGLTEAQLTEADAAYEELTRRAEQAATDLARLDSQILTEQKLRAATNAEERRRADVELYKLFLQTQQTGQENILQSEREFWEEFNAAQEAGDTNARIEAFRRLEVARADQERVLQQAQQQADAAAALRNEVQQFNAPDNQLSRVNAREQQLLDEAEQLRKSRADAANREREQRERIAEQRERQLEAEERKREVHAERLIDIRARREQRLAREVEQRARDAARDAERAARVRANALELENTGNLDVDDFDSLSQAQSAIDDAVQRDLELVVKAILDQPSLDAAEDALKRIEESTGKDSTVAIRAILDNPSFEDARRAIGEVSDEDFELLLKAVTDNASLVEAVAEIRNRAKEVSDEAVIDLKVRARVEALENFQTVADTIQDVVGGFADIAEQRADINAHRRSDEIQAVQAELLQAQQEGDEAAVRSAENKLRSLEQIDARQAAKDEARVRRFARLQAAIAFASAVAGAAQTLADPTTLNPFAKLAAYGTILAAGLSAYQTLKGLNIDNAGGASSLSAGGASGSSVAASSSALGSQTTADSNSTATPVESVVRFIIESDSDNVPFEAIDEIARRQRRLREQNADIEFITRRVS